MVDVVELLECLDDRADASEGLRFSGLLTKVAGLEAGLVVRSGRTEAMSMGCYSSSATGVRGSQAPYTTGLCTQAHGESLFSLRLPIQFLVDRESLLK